MATYLGSSADVMVNVSVVSVPATITLSGPTTVVADGSTYAYSGVFDPEGLWNPADMSVTLTIELRRGSPTGVLETSFIRYTGLGGAFSFGIQPLLEDTQYFIVVVWPGNEYYQPASTSYGVWSVPISYNTQLTIVGPSEVDEDIAVEFHGVLAYLDAGSLYPIPQSGLGLLITINDAEVATVPVTPDGAWSYTHTFVEPGAYVVKAYFAGVEI